MKKKYNYKYIVGFLLGLFIVLGSAYASIRYSSSIVLYDKNATNLISTDVQNAIDELAGIYQLPSTCPEGKICSHKLPSFITDNAVMDNVASTYVTSSTGIDFSQISSASNGQGIYIRAGTENDIYPIYYYRGAVTNNNVLFGNVCWKIVRTTDTGGVKLVYNGVPTSGSCLATTGTDTQIGVSDFNNNYLSPADVGYMNGTRYTISYRLSASLSSPYKYGNSFSYSGGTYTLVDTITSTGSWTTDYNTLNNNHYTCFNDTGVCSSLYYIYYTVKPYAYYITLTGGTGVETALDEMLTSSSNANSSTIKSYIDAWYSGTLSSVEANLEDTVWCNDREIYQLGGWNPDGGDTVTNYQLYFKPYQRTAVLHYPRLTCNSVNDSFTKSSANGNGSLDNPVGLLTADEVMLAGGRDSTRNTNYYLYTGHGYWLASPDYFLLRAYGWYVYSTGYLAVSAVDNAYGVRPSVSLKAGGIWSGDGTANNPYTVKYID